MRAAPVLVLVSTLCACRTPTISTNTEPEPARGSSGETGGSEGSGGGGGSPGRYGDDTVLLPDAATLVQPTADAGEAKVCGMPEFKLERTSVDVLLVLDVSASLREFEVEGMTAWDHVAPAVREVVKKTQTELDWGVKTFPVMRNECVVAPGVEVPIAPNNYDAVDKIITANTPPDGDGTPTGTAIDEGRKYLESIKSTRPQYMVLATDGSPSCPYRGSGEKTAHVEAIRDAFQRGIPTYVIGISDSVKKSVLLSEMAAAGGRGRMVDPLVEPMFYSAANRTELVQVMEGIANQIISCVFALTKRPPSPEDVAADILKTGGTSKDRVPRDANHANGWDYTNAEHQAIEFFGSWCDRVRDVAQEGNTVKFTFGCPGVRIP